MGLFSAGDKLEKLRLELIKERDSLKESCGEPEIDPNTGNPKYDGKALGSSLWNFKNSFEDYYHKVRYRILTDNTNEDNRWYGQILLSTTSNYCYSIGTPLSHQVNSSKITLLINPLLFVDYNLDESIVLLKHEIVHFILEHYKRVDELETSFPRIIPMLAADLVTNHLLDKERVRLLDRMWTPSKLEEKFNFKINITDTSTVESITKELANIAQTNDDFNFFITANSDSSQEELNDAIDKMIASYLGDGDAMGDDNPMFSETDAGDLLVRMMQEKSDPMLIGEMIKTVTIDANTQNRGKFPGGLAGAIKAMLEPPVITWQQEIRRFVGSIAAGKKDSIFRRKRNQPFRLDLKGKLPDKEVEIVCAIDTSGSMSDSVIAEVMKEIFAITKVVKTKITIVECDATINKVYQAGCPEEVQPDVLGRGGTEFSPVFKWMEEENKKDAILIYCTDGYGEYQLDQSIKITGQGFIWLLTEHKDDLSLKGDNLPRNSKILSLTNK